MADKGKGVQRILLQQRSLVAIEICGVNVSFIPNEVWQGLTVEHEFFLQPQNILSSISNDVVSEQQHAT